MTLFGQELKPFQASNLVVALLVNAIFLLTLYVFGITELPILLGLGFAGIVSSLCGTHGVSYSHSLKTSIFLTVVTLIMGGLGVVVGTLIQAYL